MSGDLPDLPEDFQIPDSIPRTSSFWFESSVFNHIQNGEFKDCMKVVPVMYEGEAATAIFMEEDGYKTPIAMFFTGRMVAKLREWTEDFPTQGSMPPMPESVAEEIRSVVREERDASIVEVIETIMERERDERMAYGEIAHEINVCEGIAGNFSGSDTAYWVGVEDALKWVIRDGEAPSQAFWKLDKEAE